MNIKKISGFSALLLLAMITVEMDEEQFKKFMAALKEDGQKLSETKEQYYQQFLTRKNKERQNKRNDQLPAGSRMYYYCRYCGEFVHSTSEEDCWTPVREICSECEVIKQRGWLPEFINKSR